MFSNFRPPIQFSRYHSSQQLLKHKGTFPSGLDPAGEYTSSGKNLKKESCRIKGWSPKRKRCLISGCCFLKLSGKAGHNVSVVVWQVGKEGEVGRDVWKPTTTSLTQTRLSLGSMPDHLFLHLLRCGNRGRKVTRNHICFYSRIILNTRANAFWAPSHCGFNSPS